MIEVEVLEGLDLGEVGRADPQQPGSTRRAQRGDRRTRPKSRNLTKDPCVTFADDTSYLSRAPKPIVLMHGSARVPGNTTTTEVVPRCIFLRAMRVGPARCCPIPPTPSGEDLESNRRRGGLGLPTGSLPP